MAEGEQSAELREAANSADLAEKKAKEAGVDTQRIVDSAKSSAQTQREIAELDQAIERDMQSLRDSEATKPDTTREIGGVLVEHGEASRQKGGTETDSYYANLKTPNGDATVWGVDLKRAIEQGEVQLGDQIRIERNGKAPVTVVVEKEQGTGSRSGDSVAATAKALADRSLSEDKDRAAVTDAVNERLQERAANGLPVPQVQRYDPNAPSRQQQTRESEAPNTERTQEINR